MGMGKKWCVIFKGYELYDITSINSIEYLAGLVERFNKFDIIIYPVGWFNMIYPESEYYLMHYGGEIYYPNNGHTIDLKNINNNNIFNAKIKNLTMKLKSEIYFHLQPNLITTKNAIISKIFANMHFKCPFKSNKNRKNWKE